MNIFEGARRITKIIAVMWIIGWAYNLATWSPPPALTWSLPPAKLSPQEWLAQRRSGMDTTALVKYAKLSDGTRLEFPENTSDEVMETAVKKYINDSASKDWSPRWKEIKESSYSIIGGLAFLFIFSWSIGWIVRGFAGIPSGQDKKPDDI